jgi:hypothetical protein
VCSAFLEMDRTSAVDGYIVCEASKRQVGRLLYRAVDVFAGDDELLASLVEGMMPKRFDPGRNKFGHKTSKLAETEEEVLKSK